MFFTANFAVQYVLLVFEIVFGNPVISQVLLMKGGWVRGVGDGGFAWAS